MSLSFKFDWVDPEGARGPELAATWAAFELSAGGAFVTEALSSITKSVRSTIFLPLYPLAEWFAKNLWFIYNEPFHPHWSSDQEFRSRHDIRFAAEGYLLPSLAVAASSDYATVEWVPRTAGDIRFLSRGAISGRSEEILKPIREFVALVVRRLEDCGITDTFLQNEWARIEATLADVEELEFVKVAATLGTDPYSVTDEDANQILAVADEVPLQLQGEFFAASKIGNLARTLDQLREGMAGLDANGREVEGLRALPKLTPRPNEEPWATGYRWAGELLQGFQVDLTSLDQIRKLRDQLGVSGARVLVMDDWRHGPFDALYAPAVDCGTAVAVKSARPETQLFATCRAIGDYLGRSSDSCGLVTWAATPKQKRNRAFAAELLAPADFLRSFLGGASVSTDEVEEVAAMLQVMPSVVGYQLKNHGIAEFIQ